jgi:hypothetical protein
MPWLSGYERAPSKDTTSLAFAKTFSACVGLDPRGERMPEGCFADGDPGLLNEYEKDAGPERGAMDFACGPEVVGD